MTLYNLVKNQARNDDSMDTQTVCQILTRSNLRIKKIKLDPKYKDDIIYQLDKINRC